MSRYSQYDSLATSVTPSTTTCKSINFLIIIDGSKKPSFEAYRESDKENNKTRGNNQQLAQNKNRYFYSPD